MERLKWIAFETFKFEWVAPKSIEVRDTILKVNNAVIEFEDGRLDESSLNAAITQGLKSLDSLRRKLAR
jgi:hypothetical protein